MKSPLSSYALGAVLAGTLLVLCGKKEQEKQEFIVIDTDTISVEELAKMSPDTTLSPKKLGFMVSLAKQCPERADTVAMNEAVNDFTDLLSRESGPDWTNGTAKTLYCASLAIMKKLEESTDGKTIQSYFDSIAARIFLSSDSCPVAFQLDSVDMFADTSQAGRKKQLASILSSLFHVEGNLSNVIAEFICSETVPKPDTKSVDDMVKGLVFDSTAVSLEKVPQKKIQPVKKDKSALALKYRSHQSIQKTIRGHIPILEGIYKKELKKNANMSGVVYVTFRVAASGEVISATVKSSEIAQRDFINPFLGYIKKINFKAIPETVGPMTFDFPFEFRPEL